MNQLLTDRAIRQTCRELLSQHPRITGRQLRRTLKDRFNASGKTERVFRIWREEVDAKEEAGRAPALPPDTTDLLRRLAAAETAATDNRLRAERAELREESHQDRWAAEVDQLRQTVKAQPKYAAEIRALQEQVLRLTVELHAARRLLADRQSKPPLRAHAEFC
jgi:hypothetical protein